MCLLITQLHIIKYKSKEIDKIIDEINSYGFGLTFGIHSRIEEKIEYLKQEKIIKYVAPDKNCEKPELKDMNRDKNL